MYVTFPAMQPRPLYTVMVQSTPGTSQSYSLVLSFGIDERGRGGGITGKLLNEITVAGK